MDIDEAKNYLELMTKKPIFVCNICMAEVDHEIETFGPGEKNKIYTQACKNCGSRVHVHY